MYDNPVVVPHGIQDRVLDVLHATHQGRSSMLHRAAQTVLWPGYTADIEKSATQWPLHSNKYRSSSWTRRDTL